MGPRCYAVQMHCVVNAENPNCPFPLGFRHPTGGGPSHTAIGNMHFKCGKDRASDSGDILADRQTHRHTDTHTDVLIAILQNSKNGQLQSVPRVHFEVVSLNAASKLWNGRSHMKAIAKRAHMTATASRMFHMSRQYEPGWNRIPRSTTYRYSQNYRSRFYRPLSWPRQNNRFGLCTCPDNNFLTNWHDLDIWLAASCWHYPGQVRRWRSQVKVQDRRREE